MDELFYNVYTRLDTELVKYINEVIEILENTEKKEFDTQKFSEFKDQFQWFILIGFVLIVIDIFMRDGKTIWLKNLNLFNEK